MNNWLRIENNNVIFNKSVILTIEDEVLDISKMVETCNQFIEDVVEDCNIVDITVNEGLGLIIDIWKDSRYDELLETSTFWFESYLKND